MQDCFALHPASGAFSPDDLNLMQRVFDAVCGHMRAGVDQVERRSTIASEILALFYGGARDEATLLNAIMVRAPA